jgi:RNA-splicing ligase RtcB
MNLATDEHPPGVQSGRIEVVDGPDLPADRHALDVLDDALRDVDLAAPAVVLPDFHLKGDKEIPSSIGVATRDTIRPVFTSTSLNCGMALVALDVERPGAEAVGEFYRAVRLRYPFPPTYRRDLTAEEVIRCAAEGAEFAAERFEVDRDDVASVERGGRIPIDDFGGLEAVRRELPWSVRQMSRIRFGTIGPSNHFAELQEVAEILDREAADMLGLAQGQITLQFHGGGGSLPGELGLLFGRRKRRPARPVRVQMAVQRPLYHFARARSVAALRERRALYFRDPAPPVGREGDEGNRLALANAMAMNYGFAFRLSTYASLRRLLRESFGSNARLVVDTVHNSIYDEDVGGRRSVVHRHNACRIFPAAEMADHPIFKAIGQPLLIPGTNRTSSYLCVPGDQPERSMHTACHGAGTVISQRARDRTSGPEPSGGSTLRFDCRTGRSQVVPHLDDRGIDLAVSVLEREGIVRPVARLRPFAVQN